MNMLEITLKADRRFEVGGLSVFPLTSTKSGDLAILTGPEAFDAGLIEVESSILPRSPRWPSPIWPTSPFSSSKGRCCSAATRTGR